LGRRHYEERKSRRNLVSGSDAVALWALAVFVSLWVPAGANHVPNGTAATRRVVVFGNPNLGATATTGMTSWCFANRCSPLDTYQIVAGELVEVNITASLTAVNGNLTMSVLADPGLPSGCRVTATEKLEVGGGIKAYMKRLSFTPITGQEGLVYQICVMATDTNTPTDFVTKCIRIDVRAPQIAFKTGTALTVERSVGVNCPVLLTLLPYDEGNNGYCLEMFPGKNSDTSQGTLPGGAQLTYVGTEPRAKHGTHDGCAHNEWLLAWYPTRGQEPNTYTYCVHARDTLCMGYRCELRGRELCFTVHVVKCKYCLSLGETIMHAAARYKSDWLQIWGANSHIVTPDAIPAWTSLQLGPMYSVRAGDTLESIATRFGSSSNNLLEANPDIAVVNDQGMINMGDEICVLPYVCFFEQVSSGGGAYRALD
jgi:hypothetical protein